MTTCSRSPLRWFLFVLPLVATSAVRGDTGPEKWWLRQHRMLQTNLREIDATMDLDQYVNEVVALGADVVFETAGSASGVIQSLSLARKGGRVSILGQGHEISGIETAMLCFREMEMVGTRAYTPKHWQKVSAVLLNAEEQLKQMITHRLPLSEAEQGMKLMKSREGLKIILLPWEGV